MHRVASCVLAYMKLWWSSGVTAHRQAMKESSPAPRTRRGVRGGEARSNHSTRRPGGGLSFLSRRLARVVRLRAGFLFKHEAACKQRRLFTRMNRLARREKLPAVPDFPVIGRSCRRNGSWSDTDASRQWERRVRVRHVRAAIMIFGGRATFTTFC